MDIRTAQTNGQSGAALHQGDDDQVDGHRDHHPAYVGSEPPEGSATDNKEHQLDRRSPVFRSSETCKGPDVKDVAGQEREQADPEGSFSGQGQADITDPAEEEPQ